jgi:hypothetical protein
MQSRIDDYGAESILQCLICMENHLEVSQILEGLNNDMDSIMFDPSQN